MHSSRSTLTAFTDAAADAVARAIAEVQREAKRERELREAQFAAKMAELETRLAAVAEVERRLANRLATMEEGPQGELGSGIDDIDVELADEGRTMVLRFITGEQERRFEVALPEGPTGKLPVVTAWEDRVHYQGDVVTYAGGLFQALRDTGKAPDCDDWLCIVERGKDGEDGRSFTVRGTYAADDEYQAFDVVALNGASFVAKRDDPGPCPGEGWQILSMQGKAGRPGPKGDRGERGLAVTASVSAMRIDDDGLLTLVNADGTEVRCDLYPILSKIGG